MDYLPPTPDDSPAAPPFTVLLLLVIAVLFGSMLGTGIVVGLSAARGVDLESLLQSLNEDSPLATRNFVRLVNLVSHFCTFSLPPLALALFFSRRRWMQWLSLDRYPESRRIILGIFFILAAFPMAQTTYWVNQQIPMPDWARQLESSATGMLQSLLVMNSPVELLYNLLVVAVLPAIGEELLFRGVVQRHIERWSGRGELAVWVTDALFSAIHLQFEGFLPRLLLGAALGYLFLWTRNLWVPIIAHFVFNGFQIAGQYALGDKIQSLDLEKVEDPGWGLFAAGLLLLVSTGYYLYKDREPDRTKEPKNDS